MLSRKCLLLVTGALFSSGGISTVNRLLLDCLSERFRVDVISFNEKGKIKLEGISEKLNVDKYIRCNSNKIHFVFETWKRIIQFDYSLILFDHVNLAASMFPIEILKKAPYITWIHGAEVFHPLPSLEGRIGLKFSSLCIASSNFTRQSISNLYDEERIAVCELSLPKNVEFPTTTLNTFENLFEFFEGKIQEKNQLSKARIILHVGRMESTIRSKGQEILVNAIPLVLSRHSDVFTIIVGEGENLEFIRSLANNLPEEAKARIFIPGFVHGDQLKLLYSICNLFVMTGVGEGFGLVFLEAMSQAKPCIGANSHAVPDLIKDGETGLLVDDPYSSEELAEKINWMFDHPESARQMGQNGLELVKTKYLFSHFRERFWQVLGIA